MANREPFDGRWFGIWDVEGESAAARQFFLGGFATRTEKDRVALPEGDDDRLDEYCHVFPCAWWINLGDGRGRVGARIGISTKGRGLPVGNYRP